MGSVISHDQNLFLNNSCQSILSPENKHYELFNDEGKLIFSLDTKTEVWEYYWGQCNLSNAGFAYLMAGIFALCLGACAVACVMLGLYRMCCKRKRQYNKNTGQQPQRYYGAPQRASLLDANGRPVVIVAAQNAGRFV